MALRSSWKGFVRLSLVSVPVKAYTAQASDQGEVSLNQLHKDCHSRIRYQKVCPIHGEVAKEDIVSGYEYAKGQYVIIQEDELEKLRTPEEKAIGIEKFVPPSAIDPLYFEGRTYYLVPDGPVGQKPYALLCQAMQDADRWAVAQVVMWGRDRLVVLRPMDGLLTMSFLSFENQVRQPSAVSDEVSKVSVGEEELRLARRLIDETSADEVAWSEYQDSYTQKLATLIEAKVEGREVVAPPAEEEVQVINLMDALRESVARAAKPGSAERAAASRAAKSSPAASEAAQPAKKTAASKQELAAPKRKRKTS